MLGDRIRELRKAKGLNQIEFGKKINVTKQTVSNWENGNILPSIDALIDIAVYFSCSCDYLLELDDREYAIETTGLSLRQKTMLQELANDMILANQYKPAEVVKKERIKRYQKRLDKKKPY